MNKSVLIVVNVFVSANECIHLYKLLLCIEYYCVFLRIEPYQYFADYSLVFRIKLIFMSVFNCIQCLYSLNTTMSALAFNNLSVLLPSLTFIFIFIFMGILTCIYSFYLLFKTMSA